MDFDILLALNERKEHDCANTMNKDIRSIGVLT